MLSVDQAFCESYTCFVCKSRHKKSGFVAVIHTTKVLIRDTTKVQIAHVVRIAVWSASLFSLPGRKFKKKNQRFVEMVI